MAISDPKRRYDGFLSLERGIDSGNAPDVIGRNQAAFAVNVTFRGGKPSTRPPLEGLALTFPDDGGITQTRWNTGKVQGGQTYDGGSGNSALIVARGGRLFRVDFGRQNVVSEITIKNFNVDGDIVFDTNPDDDFAFLFQAEQFMVVFQGQQSPIIYDGSTARRAVENELPACYCGAYINGRIWAALANRRDYVASDLVGTVESGSAAYNYKDSVLKITENDFLNEGGTFTTPSNFGDITAIVGTAQLDTAMGQGPVAIFTTNGVFTNQAPVDRVIWKYLQNPIQTQSLLDFGALAPRSTIPVNGDIWYRSEDGIRSWIIGRRNFNAGWGNTPMSFEMTRLLEKDTEFLLEFGSAIMFDNRLIQTCSPHRTNFGVIHRGLAVLNFDETSSMASKDDPAWEGLWNGVQRIMVLVKGRFDKVKRAFAIMITCEGEMQIWEFLIEEASTNDFQMIKGSAGSSVAIFRIPCILETRSMDFSAAGSQPFELKRLRYLECFVRDVAGQVDFDVRWKPDDHPCWNPWHEWSECNKLNRCEDPCPSILDYQPGYRTFMRTPEAPEICDKATKRLMNLGYEFQFRIAWIGVTTITKLRVHAEYEIDESMGNCR